MNQHKLIVFRAETEHTKAEREAKRARGDERSMAVLVKERAGEA